MSDAKASQCLYEDIRKRGGNGVMWKTGHSVMKAKMKEENAPLAGEISGHMFSRTAISGTTTPCMPHAG